MENKSYEKCIFFKIFCEIENKKRIARVKLTREPSSIKKIRYGLTGDPKSYTFNELWKKIFNILLTTQFLEFFVINGETGQKKLISLDILSKCPQDLSEDKTVVIPKKGSGFCIDISEAMEKIGL